MITLDTLRQLSEEELQTLTEDMQNDIGYFAIICCSHILMSNLTASQKRDFINGDLDQSIYMPPIHRDIYDLYNELINGDVDNLGMILFRRAAKSTIKNIVTLYCICFGLHEYIMFISETREQACEDLLTVQNEVLTNEVIRFLFGNMQGAIWNIKACTFNSPDGTEVFVKACGLNGGMRGTKFKGKRPSLVFSDDFESENNSTSEEGRSHVQNVINSRIMMMGSFKYKLVFMGTSVHNDAYLPSIRGMKRFNCTTGKFYESGITITPSIYIDPNSGRIKAEGPSTFEIGIPVWPSEHPYDKIKNKLEYYKEFKGGSSWWEAMQEWWNVPKSSTKPIFNAEMVQPIKAQFKKYDKITWIEKHDGTKTIKVPIYVFDGFDPAAGRDEHHDRSIKCTIGVTPDQDIIILDIMADRIDIDEQRDDIIESAIKYKPKVSIIETFGYQLGLYNLVKKRAKFKGIKINLKKYDRKVSKSNKFKSVLVDVVNGGKVCYIEGCRNIDILLMELASYGGTEHDDTIDGLYLAVWGSGNSKPSRYNVDDKIFALKRTKAVDVFNIRAKKKNKGFMCI